MSDINSVEKGSDVDLMNALTYEEFLELMLSGSLFKRYSFGTDGNEISSSGELVDPKEAFFEELSDAKESAFENESLEERIDNFCNYFGYSDVEDKK